MAKVNSDVNIKLSATDNASGAISSLKQSIDNLNKSIQESSGNAMKSVGEATDKMVKGTTDKIGKGVKSWGTQMKTSFKELGDSISLGAGVGLAALTYGLKQAVGAASNLVETNQKFGVVFKENFDQASISAANLAKNYNYSKEEAKSLLAGNASLFQGFGVGKEESLRLSEQMLQTGADIVSFQNYQGGSAEATNRIRAALLGEREALQALNMKITDSQVADVLKQKGQDKLTGSALTLAKAQAALIIIQNQSKNANGDVARSVGTYEYEMRRLIADFKDLTVQIGQIFLPLGKELLAYGKEIVASLGDWIKNNKELTLTLTKVALVILALGAILSPINKIMTATSAIVNITKLAFTGLSAAIGVVATTVLGFVAAITAGLYLLYSFRSEFQDWFAGMEKWREKLFATGSYITAFFYDLFRPILMFLDAIAGAFEYIFGASDKKEISLTTNQNVNGTITPMGVPQLTPAGLSSNGTTSANNNGQNGGTVVINNNFGGVQISKEVDGDAFLQKIQNILIRQKSAANVGLTS